MPRGLSPTSSSSRLDKRTEVLPILFGWGDRTFQSSQAQHLPNIVKFKIILRNHTFCRGLQDGVLELALSSAGKL